MTFLRFSAISAVLALALAVGMRFYSTAGASGEPQRIATPKAIEAAPVAAASVTTPAAAFEDVALVASVPKRVIRPNQ